MDSVRTLSEPSPGRRQLFPKEEKKNITASHSPPQSTYLKSLF
jgi:hypothetical protein